jgi:hypothetical protein
VPGAAAGACPAGPGGGLPLLAGCLGAETGYVQVWHRAATGLRELSFLLRGPPLTGAVAVAGERTSARVLLAEA